MALDIITLQCFLSVAETKNITQSANQIGRTQSAVSQQITRLESLLNKSLFNRENNFSLTHDGEIFYEYAQKILQLQLEAISTLKGVELENEIKIGLPEDFAFNFLSTLVYHFMRKFPSVYLNVECDLNNCVKEKFQQNALDLCLIKEFDRAVIPENACVVEEQLIWVGSKKIKNQLTNLNEIPLVLSPEISLYRTLALETLDKANLKYRIVFSSRNYSSKISAIQSGLGITIAQKSLITVDDNLFEIPKLPPLKNIHLCILRNKNSPAIQYLEQLLLNIMTGKIF